LEAQIAAEAPALRSNEGTHGPETLLDLITDAIASSEGRCPYAFMDGALRTRSDDLDALFHACSVEGGLVNYEMDLDKLPTMLWRLSMRARAAADIASRLQQTIAADERAREAVSR
jgi:hypothetical protein